MVLGQGFTAQGSCSVQGSHSPWHEGSSANWPFLLNALWMVKDLSLPWAGSSCAGKLLAVLSHWEASQRLGWDFWRAALMPPWGTGEPAAVGWGLCPALPCPALLVPSWIRQM